MSVNRHFDSMLFNYETTNRTDFQYNTIHNITPTPKTVYQEKPRSKRPGSPQKFYIHTLTKWKISKIPTELYVKRKEIVRTNPRDIEMQSQEPVNEIKISDKDRQKVQATRPRLVMTPAVSMDDIDNSEARELLINDIYQSSVQKMQEEIRNSWRDHSYRAPLNGQLTCAQPITLQKLQVPYVSPEWRMDSISWDNLQIRAYCDPCKEFYLSREPKCSACDFTAAKESKKKAKKTK